MSGASSHERLIQTLGTELAPVRRLRSPLQRMLGWLALLVLLAAVLIGHFGFAPMLARWQATPDLAWAGVGAVATAVAAAWSTFVLGVPGRSSRWAWLPLPPALLWIGASGLGCLRRVVAPGTHVATVAEAPDCLVFILAFSIPLSIILIWLLRRAYPLRPVLAAVMIGLASAAASASLLEICHAYDAAATDLAMHAVAVLLVIAVNAIAGGRLLQRR
jgi:hypothetical protein